MTGKLCGKCGSEKRQRPGSGQWDCIPCLRASTRRWRLANIGWARAASAERKRRWRERHGNEADARRLRAWARANRDRDTARRAVRRQVAGRRMPWYDARAVLRYYRTARALRGMGLNIHVDHYVPLKGRKACGFHSHHNLRLAFARENMRKSAALVHDEHIVGPVPGQFRTVTLS